MAMQALTMCMHMHAWLILEATATVNNKALMFSKHNLACQGFRTLGLLGMGSMEVCFDFLMYFFTFQNWSPFTSTKGSLLVQNTAYSEIWSLHLTHPWGAESSHSVASKDQFQILASTSVKT